MLGEELNGVVAEASVEVLKPPGRSLVDAQFERAWLGRFGGLDLGRIIRGDKVRILRSLDKPASFFGCFGGFFPFGIGDESFPRFLARLAARISEQENQFVLWLPFFIHRHPVADVLYAVLFEQAKCVLAESIVKILKLAGR